MVEQGATSGGQLDAVHDAAHQLNADLLLVISDLATEGRLRRVQPLLGGERQASLLCDRNEIAQVPQLHSAFHISEACPSAYKVFFPGARGAYLCRNRHGQAEKSVAAGRLSRFASHALRVGQTEARGVIHEHVGCLDYWGLDRHRSSHRRRLDAVHAAAHQLNADLIFENWLPEAMRILHDELPNIEITVSSQNSPDLADALMRGRFDAAFMRPESAGTSSFTGVWLRSRSSSCSPATIALPRM